MAKHYLVFIHGIGNSGLGNIHKILQAPELFSVTEIKFNGRNASTPKSGEWQRFVN